MFSKLHFKTLRSWLTLWFMILALVPLTITGVITYSQRVEAIQTRVFAKLSVIRDLKVNQINAWLNDRGSDLKVLAANLEPLQLTDNISVGRSERKNPQHIKEARGVLQSYVTASSHYDELFIIDIKNGQIILSSNKAREGIFQQDDFYFTETLKSRTLTIKDIYYSKTLKKPSMAFSLPLFDPADNTQMTAILVARIDLQNSIYKLLLDRTGMGTTGETLIISKEGLALNELRGHDNAPLNLKINAQPAVLAVQGREGIIEVNDYRGEKVLAAYKHIPLTGWGFVSKQDAAEAYTQIMDMLLRLTLLFVLSAVVIIFSAFAIARRIVAPIVTLKEIATRQQQGDFAARNKIERADELGYLARAFNDLSEEVSLQMNIQQGNNEIVNAIVDVESLTPFTETLVDKIRTITAAQLAAFYLKNDDNQTFELVTSIGLGEQEAQGFAAEFLEGEFGAALVSRQIERITDIPQDTRFVFNAVAGQLIPREIITIPLLERGEVKAVISLASLQGFSAESLNVLERCWIPVSNLLCTFLSNEKNKLQALELTEKNEKLQLNTEELQSQSEELREQAEELREQADELRSTAAELETRRAQVEDADRLKSEFLSNMSHELRTPLNSVLALSQLMIARGTGKNPSEEKNFLEVIERNGQQLLSLINDILDLAKIESGRMDIYPIDFSLQQATKRALSTIRPLAERKGLTITAQVEAPLPMTSDEEKLNQILLNLLSNAVKFTDQGEISLEVNATEKSVCIVVRDTGIGMTPTELPHIFDEFRQVDGTTTRKYEGTGLGLSICQKLADLLGGEILVESTLGEGSIFTLNLPLKIASTSDSHQPQSTQPRTHSELSSGQGLRRTVLVIDDEREVRELVSKHLSEAGYEVVLAANGREGLRLARELRPFAITLDVMMPEVDGWEVLKALKAAPLTADIPVVMLSVSEDRATGFALGAAGYLTKPVDKTVLCAELEKLGGPKELKRVLVVDDDEVVREHIQRILLERGYQVSQAEGGAQALADAKDFPPDVILLDLLLPDVDGFMVLEKLRADPELSDLPVLVLTAKDLTETERAVLKTSVNKIIAKNLSNDGQFLDEVIEALQQLEAGRAETSRKKPKILVVEDNETAALQIITALEEIDIEVSLATGGAEGLESVKRSVPDALVLDLMMPGVDGFEVLETIRSTPWTELLPVLVLTAKELTTQDRSRLKHNHVKQLIQKGSVNKAQLIAAVRQLLEPDVVSPQPNIAVAPPTKQSQSRTVLVVEDNPDNLLTIQLTLAQEDYLVISATDGLQGLKIAQKERPGLILMDMQLPVMNGMEATRKIKENPLLTGIPIIALTANAMKGDREAMLDAGCVEYLSKPFDPTELQVLVRKWLKSGV